MDAVDGADVDAGAVLDVDAGLGDDVRHGAYSTGASSPSISSRARSNERGFRDTWSKPAACARRSPAVSVWFVKPRIGTSGIGVRDVVRVDPRDVCDHEIGRVDSVRGLEAMLREQCLELPAEEEVDPTRQDRRHAASRTIAPCATDYKRASRLRAPAVLRGARGVRAAWRAAEPGSATSSRGSSTPSSPPTSGAAAAGRGRAPAAEGAPPAGPYAPRTAVSTSRRCSRALHVPRPIP